MEEKTSHGLSWQDPQLTFFNAIFVTLKQILFSPGKFFNNLDTYEGPLVRSPFVFYITVSFCSILISMIIEAVIAQLIHNINFLNAFGFLTILILFLLAVALIIGIYLYSLILHLFVLIFRGKGGFEGTFAVLAFSSAAFVFRIIPGVGEIIYCIWALVITIIGFKIVHKMGIPRALGVVFSPIILAVLLAGLIIAIFPSLKLLTSESTGIEDVLASRDRAQEAGAITACKLVSGEFESQHKYNGIYPSSLNEIITDPTICKAVSPSTAIDGYYFEYKLINKDHFTFYARPAKTNGKRTFYVDQAGEVRDGGPEGKPSEYRTQTSESGYGKLVSARSSAFESKAVCSMHIFSTACESYRAAQPQVDYPKDIKVLADANPPYINGKLSNAVSPSTADDGYYYEYNYIDSKHYSIYARPVDNKNAKTFYVDDTGIVREGGPRGKEVK